MPRKKKTIVDPKSTPNLDITPNDLATIPSCSRCHTPYIWRDHAYGASSRNLCRTHDQQRQRAALRGVQLSVAPATNRAMRRAAWFDHGAPTSLSSKNHFGHDKRMAQRYAA